MNCINTKLLRVRYALESMNEYEQEAIVKYIEFVAAGLIRFDLQDTKMKRKNN